MQRVQGRQFLRIISPAILSLVVFYSSSFATWKRIGKLPIPIASSFFLDPNHGFVGSGFYSTPTPLSIYLTTDGGITWTVTATPSGFGQVTQIAINPNGTGYASVFSSADPLLNLLGTTDGGYTWKDISSGSHYGTGVGLAGQTAQWSVMGNATNNTNGVFTMAGGNTIITPGPNSAGMGEAWGAYGDSAHKIWYMVTELSRQLYISTDLGVTWKGRFNFGGLMTSGGIPTGDIFGSGNTLYVQTEFDGILRGSVLDTGVSWIPIGGPSNDADTRTIYSTGCFGQNIIVFNKAGEIWVSNDGGDGTLSSVNPLNIQHIKFPAISSCLNDTKFATITNHGCQPFVISGVTLLNNAAGVYSLVPPISLPDTLASGVTDTIVVKFDPKLIPGAYNAKIDVQGYFEAGFGTGVVPVDSNISISGLSNAEAPQTQTNPQLIDFDSVSICGDERDSIFTIKNIGCDTLQIESGPGNTDSAFMVTNFPLPFFLAPDSVFIIHVHFKPLIAGPVSSDPLFHLSAQGITRDVTFHIQGNGIAGLGVISLSTPLTLTFDTLTICSQPDSIKAFITNTGCAAFEIFNMVVPGSKDFSVYFRGANGSGNQFIEPGDTLFFIFRFSPNVKGDRQDALQFEVKGLNGAPPTDARYIFHINGFVADGAAALMSSVKTIDFGTTSLCQGKDSTITLSNTGCDTLQITDAKISGLGFVVSGYSFPIVIPPDSSTKIRIFTVLDTAGGKTLMQDSLIVTSNSDSSFAPISLTRRVTPIREVGMYLDAIPQTGTVDDFVSYNVKESPAKTFKGAAVQNVDFDLAYNTDLLQFDPAKSSPNIRSSDGQHFSLNASGAEIDADANGILASVAFDVYLTKDSTTTITLNNVVLNGIDSTVNPCGMILSFSGSAAFDYQYFCGERSISRIMRGENILDISSVVPNPARDEIVLSLRSAQYQDAKIEITDALGVHVFSVLKNITIGASSIHLNTKDLPTGLYLIRITSAGGSASQEFLKVR